MSNLRKWAPAAAIVTTTLLAGCTMAPGPTEEVIFLPDGKTPDTITATKGTFDPDTGGLTIAKDPNGKPIMQQFKLSDGYGYGPGFVKDGKNVTTQPFPVGGIVCNAGDHYDKYHLDEHHRLIKDPGFKQDVTETNTSFDTQPSCISIMNAPIVGVHNDPSVLQQIAPVGAGVAQGAGFALGGWLNGLATRPSTTVNNNKATGGAGGSGGEGGAGGAGGSTGSIQLTNEQQQAAISAAYAKAQSDATAKLNYAPKTVTYQGRKYTYGQQCGCWQ